MSAAVLVGSLAGQSALGKTLRSVQTAGAVMVAAASATSIAQARPPNDIHPHLQCVPFARWVSNISVIGDAWTWWRKAEGRYQRGRVPEPGSVLAFREDERMPLGHVAVVTRVVGSRLIEIDHANWAAPGMITRQTPVVDVSPHNDWTMVRIQTRSADIFGNAYATYGFIYERAAGTAKEVGPNPFSWTQENKYTIRIDHTLPTSKLPQVIYLK